MYWNGLVRIRNLRGFALRSRTLNTAPPIVNISAANLYSPATMHITAPLTRFQRTTSQPNGDTARTRTAAPRNSGSIPVRFRFERGSTSEPRFKPYPRIRQEHRLRYSNRPPQARGVLRLTSAIPTVAPTRAIQEPSSLVTLRRAPAPQVH